MGLVFQVPVGILAATRAGVVTPKQLRHNRRYAILACGAVAAFLPGDAITLVLETVPLYLLFELSVLLATVMERREKRRGGEAAPL
jgi:sec-independent protein translocase protein TatC